tara:strand:- start:218 stop:757 length:540 start_codon:yes stop_codon:yes gene_type:complete
VVEVVTTTIMDLKTQHSEIKKSNGVTRSELENFGNFLTGIDNVFIGDTINCPLKHSFSDNIYVREISIPKGTVLVGKIHKHEHPNFLMSGKVRVVTEETSEVLEGPLSMISSPGTKRALIALTDLVWITIHHNPTNTRDLKEIEKIVIADSYEDYDKFVESKKKVSFKLKNKLIKLLSK